MTEPFPNQVADLRVEAYGSVDELNAVIGVARLNSGQNDRIDAMRGRIMSLYSVTLVGMAPFGSLLAGAAASFLDAPTTIALAGGLCVAGVALSTILDREPRQKRPA